MRRPGRDLPQSRPDWQHSAATGPRPAPRRSTTRAGGCFGIVHKRAALQQRRDRAEELRISWRGAARRRQYAPALLEASPILLPAILTGVKTPGVNGLLCKWLEKNTFAAKRTASNSAASGRASDHGGLWPRFPRRVASSRLNSAKTAGWPANRPRTRPAGPAAATTAAAVEMPWRPRRRTRIPRLRPALLR